MKVTLNGKPTQIDREGISLLEFVGSRKVQVEGVIAALNDKVVARDRWAQTLIADGDCLELVSLVGGG